MVMSELLGNKRISLKRVQGELVYKVTKGIFTAEKVFVTNVQGVKLKLFVQFFYNLYELGTLKMKGIF
jgi:hypothetical protein